MDLTADLDMLFVDTGISAQVMSDSYLAGEILLLWESPGRVQNLFDGALETTEPAGVAKSSDVATLHIVHGSKLIISGTTWHVIGIMPDGSGLTRLTLSSSPIQ